MIGFVGREVPDEVKNLDGDFLLHRLDARIKLGWTYCLSFESELGFQLTNHVSMLCGQKRGSFTATVLRRLAAERAVGTPSRTAGSPGIANS